MTDLVPGESLALLRSLGYPAMPHELELRSATMQTRIGAPDDAFLMFLPTKASAIVTDLQRLAGRLQDHRRLNAPLIPGEWLVVGQRYAWRGTGDDFVDLFAA